MNLTLPRPCRFLPFRCLVFVSLGSGAVAADNPIAPESLETRRTRFAYDQAADFSIESKGTETRGAATLRDVTFVAAPVEPLHRIAAYIISPRTGTPRAAILWVHWLGEPATTNRTEFLDEAVALADRGVVSLLVDAMWAKPRWYRDRVLADDYKNSVTQVVAIRRALDLLRRQPGAASVPVGIVGHDYGGMYATLAAAADTRATTCVFVACTPSLLDWAFFQSQPASKDDYIREQRSLALTDAIGALGGASVLLQFAEQDRYVPLEKAQEFFAAAKAPKQMAVYGGAEHSMTKPAAIRLDRLAWLVRELGLDRK